MKADILIKHGRVITHFGMFEADVAIYEEKILGMFAPGFQLDAEQIVDATGMLVLPGLIDAHAHFNEPGREDLLLPRASFPLEEPTGDLSPGITLLTIFHGQGEEG